MSLVNRAGSVTQTGTGVTTVDVAGSLDNAGEYVGGRAIYMSSSTKLECGTLSCPKADDFIRWRG